MTVLPSFAQVFAQYVQQENDSSKANGAMQQLAPLQDSDIELDDEPVEWENEESKEVRTALAEPIRKHRRQYTLKQKVQALLYLQDHSQGQLEAKMGIPHSTISGWVRDKEKILSSCLSRNRRRLTKQSA